MTRVYLVRHAEAEGNLYRRIHGQYDSLITETGKMQIEALRRRFEGVNVDAVYSSSLTRTRTTAEAIYKPRGLKLNVRKELMEIGMGCWEDKTWGEVARQETDMLECFNRQPTRWSVSGSEDFSVMNRRVVDAILKIASNHPEQTVAVVSHGTAIRSALCYFSGIAMDEIAAIEHSDNTAVSLLEVNKEEIIIPFKNDNSHLDSTISTFSRQKWWRTEDGVMADQNIWFRPVDLEREESLYTECRRDAWELVHGSAADFDGQGYWQGARTAALQHKQALICAMLGDKVAGILQLDVDRDADKEIGHIPFYYMKKEYRDHGMGVQLMGQAVSTYRTMGRKTLRLRVAPENVHALHFYEKYGFHNIGEEPGVVSKLFIMEKGIGYPLQ